MCKQQAPRRAPLAARAPEMGHGEQLVQQPLDLRLDLHLHLICLRAAHAARAARAARTGHAARAARAGLTALEGSGALESAQFTQRMARRRPLPMPRLRPRLGLG